MSIALMRVIVRIEDGGVKAFSLLLVMDTQGFHSLLPPDSY